MHSWTQLKVRMKANKEVPCYANTFSQAKTAGNRHMGVPQGIGRGNICVDRASSTVVVTAPIIITALEDMSLRQANAPSSTQGMGETNTDA